MIRRKRWVVVADGARLRVFEPNRERHGLDPILDETHDAARRKAAELLADKPGRTFDRNRDHNRHAMELPTDPKRVEKQRFAHRIAELLEQALDEGRYEELVLVAAPRMLGELRECLSERVRETVRQEIDKDLTPLEHAELEAQLRPVLWPGLAQAQ